MMVTGHCNRIVLSLLLITVAGCGGGGNTSDGSPVGAVDAATGSGAGCVESWSGAVTVASSQCRPSLVGPGLNGEMLVIGGGLDLPVGDNQNLSLQLPKGVNFAVATTYHWTDLGGNATVAAILGGAKDYAIAVCAGSSLTLVFTSLDSPPAANMSAPTSNTHGTLDVTLPESSSLGGKTTCTGGLLTVHITF